MPIDMNKLVNLTDAKAGIDAEHAMVASTYSSSATYAVGDYVYYNNTLYRCITAITTAEAWTAAHWTVAKLAEDVTSQSKKIEDLNNLLDYSIAGKQTQISFTTASGTGSIDFRNGDILTSSVYKHTDYIDVSSFYSIAFKIIGSTSSTVTAGMAYYNENKQYISGIQGLRSQASAGYASALYVSIVPQTAKYARFTTYIDTATRGDFALYANGFGSELAKNICGLLDAAAPMITEIASGTIASDGTNSSSTKRLRTIKPLHDSVAFIDAHDYLMCMFAYNKSNGNFVGTVLDNGTVSTTTQYYSTDWFSTINLIALRSTFPNYFFRIVFKKTDDSDMTVNDSSNITYYTIPYKASGIVTQSKRVIDTVSEYYALFDQFVTDGFCTKTTLETVQDLPIYQYDFTGMDDWIDGSDYTIVTDTRLFNKFQILAFSGIHGDEKDAPIALYEFMRKVCYDKEYVRYLPLCDFHVVPICNPTGYNANTRDNYQEIDLNRIDESYNTLECIALKGVIDSQAYDLFIDFHTMRTDSSTYRTGETGSMAFANNTPDATLTKEYRVVMEAGAKTGSILRDQFGMSRDNNLQNFYPWKGQEEETFRNYAFTHTSGGETVGSPISAVWETSDKCYTFSNSTVDNNATAQWIAVNFLDKAFTAFIDKVTEGYF